MQPEKMKLITKKQSNKCMPLRKNSIKLYFQNVSRGSITTMKLSLKREIKKSLEDRELPGL